MTDFCLSDKENMDGDGDYNSKDVKEFIRLLKISIGDSADQTDIWADERYKSFRKVLVKSIDKLAGEKLK